MCCQAPNGILAFLGWQASKPVLLSRKQRVGKPQKAPYKERANKDEVILKYCLAVILVNPRVKDRSERLDFI